MPVHPTNADGEASGPVLVKPGAVAGFAIEYPHFDDSTHASCEPVADRVIITIPGDTGQLATSAYPPQHSGFRINPCGGQINVYPFRTS
jgi:hypothetical protein